MVVLLWFKRNKTPEDVQELSNAVMLVLWNSVAVLVENGLVLM